MQSDWKKQKLIFEQKIELLNDQLQEYNKREQQHKLLNDHLMIIVNQFKDNSQQINHLTFQNKELKKALQQEKKKHQYIESHSENEILKLKQQLALKNRQIQIINLKHQKDRFQLQNYISQLQTKIKQKNSKIERLQQRIHNILLNEISQSQIINSKSRFLVNDLEGSTVRYGEQNQIRLSNIRKNRVQQYMKMDKSEIKVIVNSLKNAKQKLDQGNHNISCLNEGITQKINKTFYK